MPVLKKIWDPLEPLFVVVKEEILGKVNRQIPSMLDYQSSY